MLRAEKVKDIEWFSKSDPFLRIYRPSSSYIKQNAATIPENGWVMVTHTNYIKDNLNPVFDPFTISGQKLCKNNLQSPMKVEIWDHSKRGKHTYISKAFFTMMDLVQGKIQFVDTYDKSSKFSGRVIFERFSSNKIYSMVDLINAGMEMSLYIAIDFTGSNGSADRPSSLHYMNPNGAPNQYQQAIMGVGSILQNYDSDKQIPTYGFGAKWTAAGINSTSFCFPLSGNPAQPFGNQINGVFQLYQQALPQLQFSGPTNFAPCIYESINAVSQSVEKFCYSVLLILTDGLITDMNETISAIVEASRLPMSIIIIGVGNENFGQMEMLDGDNQVLCGRNGAALRDIVQFVAFNQVQGSYGSLASAVLRELPSQISSYYRVTGKQPPL